MSEIRFVGKIWAMAKEDNIKAELSKQSKLKQPETLSELHDFIDRCLPALCENKKSSTVYTIRNLPMAKSHTFFSDKLAEQGYDHALAHAIRLCNSNPKLPPLPGSTSDPITDLRFLQEWCIKAQNPAETGRNTTPTKFRRIIIYLKKVVEKAWQIFTKSFWESVLERVWPKG